MHGKHKSRITTIAFFAIAVLFSAGCSNDITVMSYNVEGLFDDTLDGSEYAEYRPAPGRWTAAMYGQRLDSIRKVITAAVPGGPDIIALQEIENMRSLDDLNARFDARSRYAYRCIVPVPGSATNTAILSRYPVKRVGAFQPRAFDERPLRNILEAEIDINGATLHMFCNHWKSKEGGAAATESARIEAAALLVKRIRAILRIDASADIIIAGDLNERATEYEDTGESSITALMPESTVMRPNVDEDTLFVTANALKAGTIGSRIVAYNPWLEAGRENEGSYMFGDKWETIDHIILSAGLFDSGGLTYKKGSFCIVRPSFLIDRDSGRPLRWDRMRKRGYSDHLPILVRLIPR